MDNKTNNNQGVATRVAAAQALGFVFDQALTLDDAHEKVESKHRLSAQDRRLVHAICGFVFRNLNNIDPIILKVMDRKRPPSPRLLHHLLRVGIAQLLFMDIPAHAAVNACVSGSGSLHLSKQKGLVNAVLRAVHRQKESLLEAANHSTNWVPEWLAQRWSRHYGEGQANLLIRYMRSEQRRQSLSHQAGQFQTDPRT